VTRPAERLILYRPERLVQIKSRTYTQGEGRWELFQKK
jgi:hypothetical protein